jgi:hypothetical protein
MISVRYKPKIVKIRSAVSEKIPWKDRLTDIQKDRVMTAYLPLPPPTSSLRGVEV